MTVVVFPQNSLALMTLFTLAKKKPHFLYDSYAYKRIW